MDQSEVKHLPKVDHTPAELSEDAKVLLKAAAIIEERGHTKGQLCASEGGAVCLMGAINCATTGQPHWSRIGDEQRKRNIALGGRVFGGSAEKAVEWNNAHERTSEEVIGRLRAVALGL